MHIKLPSSEMSSQTEHTCSHLGNLQIQKACGNHCAHPLETLPITSSLQPLLPDTSTQREIHPREEAIIWSQPGLHPYLLVVLDAHAECIDQDSDHDSPAKVFAIYDLPECVTDESPESQHRTRLCIWAQAALPPAVGVPEVTVLSVLCELIHSLTV